MIPDLRKKVHDGDNIIGGGLKGFVTFTGFLVLYIFKTYNIYNVISKQNKLLLSKNNLFIYIIYYENQDF